MIFIQLLACIGLIIGLFILLKINLVEFTDSLFAFFTKKSSSIKDEINEVTKRKKPNFIKREIGEAQNVLRMTGKSNQFSLICGCSLLLFTIGCSVSLLIGNLFLAPILAFGLMLLPFWYVKLTTYHFKKDVSAELETSLSIITTSYLRNEDIVTAIEENLDYLNPPVFQVFKDFILQIKMVNPDIMTALKVLKCKIENDVFKEWCDALCDCQYDRSLKSTLTPIVTKLSDMRIVNGELEQLVIEPRNEFIIMVLLVIGNVPLLYLINESWYDTLMNTPTGQIILTITVALIFTSVAFVIKLTKPIEYRR